MSSTICEGMCMFSLYHLRFMTFRSVKGCFRILENNILKAVQLRNAKILQTHIPVKAVLFARSLFNVSCGILAKAASVGANSVNGPPRKH